MGTELDIEDFFSFPQLGGGHFMPTLLGNTKKYMEELWLKKQ